jgi:hypothetical protein
MSKRTISCVIILLCAINIFAQTRRRSRSAAVKAQPGYYFVINTCNACCFDWHNSAVNLFKASGIPSAIVTGSESHSNTEAFKSIRSFEKIFNKNVSRDSEICAQISVYVGPFLTENDARNALEKFPSILVSVLRQGSDRYSEDELKALENAPIVQDGTSSSWTFGIDSGGFFVEGYHLISQPKISRTDLANKSWLAFWTKFSTAVKNKDRVAVKRLMVPEEDFMDGGGIETRDEYLERLDKDRSWGLLQRSIVKGTTTYNYGDTNQRSTKDGHLVFHFVNGMWRFVGVMGD